MITVASTGKRDRALEQRPLGSQIADHVRQDILLGRLRAGELIRQDELSAEFGTSRMPVRDALRRLASEGLVVNTQSRRLEVAQLTILDIEESFVVEALVHSRAARRATRGASEADLDFLQELHDAMLEASGEGDLKRVAELNWQFHRQINVLANSPKLIAILRTVSVSIPRDYLVEMPKDALKRSHRDHERIVNAMRRGDENQVEELTRSHVEEAGERLVARFIEIGLLGDGISNSSTPSP